MFGVLTYLSAQKTRLQQRLSKRMDKSLPVFRYHLRPTDVFLVGHPKSGNTWLAYMLAIALQKDGLPQVTLANIGEHVPVFHGIDGRIRKFSYLPEPRIFRNEIPLYPDLYPKTIYLLRDPRAVLASLYHMYCVIFDDWETPLLQFVKEYISQGCIKRWEPNQVRWDVQVLNWLKRAEQDKHIIVVRYEDIVYNRAGVLRKVMRFARLAYTEENMALAVTKGAFEAMRKDEEEHGAESYPGQIGKRGRFVRKGKVSGWKEELDQSLAKLIESEFAPAMRAAGYL